MVNISQVQKGFAKFMDNDISVAFEGWQKVVIIGAGTLLAANIPNLVKQYGEQPMVSALGVYDANAKTIDIDKLYNAFIPNMGAEKIPISIPKIGTIRMGREEIDNLIRYIKEG